MKVKTVPPQTYTTLSLSPNIQIPVIYKTLGRLHHISFWSTRAFTISKKLPVPWNRLHLFQKSQVGWASCMEGKRRSGLFKRLTFAVKCLFTIPRKLYVNINPVSLFLGLDHARYKDEHKRNSGMRRLSFWSKKSKSIGKVIRRRFWTTMQMHIVGALKSTWRQMEELGEIPEGVSSFELPHYLYRCGLIFNQPKILHRWFWLLYFTSLSFTCQSIHITFYFCLDVMYKNWDS